MNRAFALVGLFTLTSGGELEAAADVARATGKLGDDAAQGVSAAQGTIYRVPGSGTPSGKPYIGRHNKPDPAKTRRSQDGRDRKQAKVIDTHDPKNALEGRVKEQQQITKQGLGNLDNRRNEIRQSNRDCPAATATAAPAAALRMNQIPRAQARAFWQWFCSVMNELASDFANERILRELDRRVTRFGKLTWEVGPGLVKPNALVISPGGSKELLQLTEEIVSLAPEISEWEFHSAKPPKRWDLRFTMEDEAGLHEIDARDWEYLLLRFPDGTFDVTIRAANLPRDNDDLTRGAAEVAVDGIVGEASRLRYLANIDVVTEFDETGRRKATNVKHLADHLASLVS